MKISDICIRRPVFATVLSLTVMLIGLVSYSRLSVREYPKIDEPVVTVDTTYRGASADIIESQITKPLEDSLAGIEGVDVITSISRQENSQISVRFKLERNPDSAAADVRDRVSRVRNKLPTAIDEPVIAKVEADANPIIWIAFSSDKHSPLEVTDFASRIVKPRLQTLPGAADVRVFGERKFAMRVWINPERLAAHGLTPADVEDAIRKQLSQYPVKTRLSLTGTMVVARDIAHAKLKERLDAGHGLPDYIKRHPVYYAGPAKTPQGMATGSFGPTTAGRMDSYVAEFQEAGGSMVMLAKGNRSRAVRDACKKFGGFYLGSVGGPAARLAQDCIRKVEVLEYPELGMEAVWRIEVVDFPAFIVVDDKGNDFFADIEGSLKVVS